MLTRTASGASAAKSVPPPSTCMPGCARDAQERRRRSHSTGRLDNSSRVTIAAPWHSARSAPAVDLSRSRTTRRVGTTWVAAGRVAVEAGEEPRGAACDLGRILGHHGSPGCHVRQQHGRRIRSETSCCRPGGQRADRSVVIILVCERPVGGVDVVIQSCTRQRTRLGCAGAIRRE